ncbi:MAG: response regulator [Clostridia bacterium]|nr:response regulator [Clostridia bacterium]
MANILIVDDSLIMRRNLSMILKEAGHTIVGEAGNGQQAILLYRRYKPDLVTMDITMPNIDGIDALKHIMTEDPSAKVIMISALDQKAKVYTALRSGAKHYILKPLTAEKINSVIDEVLSKEPAPVDVIQKEDKIEQAFFIKNEPDLFKIIINRDLAYEDVLVLMHAIQGFLYLESFAILFDFQKFMILDEEGLSKFDGIINKIRSASGDFMIRGKNPEFIKKMTQKDEALVQSFELGEFVLE